MDELTQILAGKGPKTAFPETGHSPPGGPASFPDAPQRQSVRTPADERAAFPDIPRPKSDAAFPEPPRVATGGGTAAFPEVPSRPARQAEGAFPEVPTPKQAAFPFPEIPQAKVDRAEFPEVPRSQAAASGGAFPSLPQRGEDSAWSDLGQRAANTGSSGVAELLGTVQGLGRTLEQMLAAMQALHRAGSAGGTPGLQQIGGSPNFVWDASMEGYPAASPSIDATSTAGLNGAGGYGSHASRGQRNAVDFLEPSKRRPNAMGG